MPWKKVSLTSDEVADGLHFELRNEFVEAFMAAGSPAGAAMLRRENEHEYFFSPEAVVIFDAGIIKWMAGRCDIPARPLLLVEGHFTGL